MNNYVYIASDTSLMVLNTLNGEQITIYQDDPRFIEAVELAKVGSFEAVLAMSVKQSLLSFFVGQATDSRVAFKIEDGVGLLAVHGMEVEINSAITARVIDMHTQGFDCQPMLNFLSNLYMNPSSTAVNELFGFIEASNLPITEDGCFIAYKIVKENYMDIYSGTMSNTVGSVLAMPRNMVDDNRNNTCSAGLHFCSKEYLSHYGSSSRTADRCVLVKINPADVVSIPADYNNAKGRTWKYEVVGEVTGTWRDTLPTTDYTASAVVDEDGNEYDEDEYDEDDDDERYNEGYDDGANAAFTDYTRHYDRISDEDEMLDAYDSGYKAGFEDNEGGQ